MSESGNSRITEYSLTEGFWLIHTENELKRVFPYISENLGVDSIPISISLTLKPEREGYLPRTFTLKKDNPSKYSRRIIDKVLEGFELESGKSIPIKIDTEYMEGIKEPRGLKRYNDFLLESLVNIEVAVLMETVDMIKGKVKDEGILGLGMVSINKYLDEYEDWLKNIGWNKVPHDERHSSKLVETWEESYNKAIGKYSARLSFQDHPVIGRGYVTELSSKKLLEQLCDPKGGSTVESIEALRVKVEKPKKGAISRVKFPFMGEKEVKRSISSVAFPLLSASSKTLRDFLWGDK